MNRIAQVSPRLRVLLSVVHPVRADRELTGAELEIDAGADRVSPIIPCFHEREGIPLIAEVCRRHPSLWFGVTLLSRAPAHALAFALEECGRIDVLWSDNAGQREVRRADLGRATQFAWKTPPA